MLRARYQPVAHDEQSSAAFSSTASCGEGHGGTEQDGPEGPGGSHRHPPPEGAAPVAPPAPRSTRRSASPRHSTSPDTSGTATPGSSSTTSRWTPCVATRRRAARGRARPAPTAPDPRAGPPRDHEPVHDEVVLHDHGATEETTERREHGPAAVPVRRPVALNGSSATSPSGRVRRSRGERGVRRGVLDRVERAGDPRRASGMSATERAHNPARPSRGRAGRAAAAHLAAPRPTSTAVSGAASASSRDPSRSRPPPGTWTASHAVHPGQRPGKQDHRHRGEPAGDERAPDVGGHRRSRADRADRREREEQDHHQQPAPARGRRGHDLGVPDPAQPEERHRSREEALAVGCEEVGSRRARRRRPPRAAGPRRATAGSRGRRAGPTSSTNPPERRAQRRERQRGGQPGGGAELPSSRRRGTRAGSTRVRRHCTPARTSHGSTP